MKQQIKKIIYLISGLFFVILGIIGMFLPILPTTPFLIIAVYFFVESSPKLHKMLLNNKYFGEDLQRWEKEKTVKHEIKIKAMLLVIASSTLTMFLVHPRLELQVVLLSLYFFLLVIIWRLKEKP